ncbi:MAG TPA: ATP-binding protein [Verrucomicrobiae bacterium]|nr:ATP-binding protein [Verrucomicrobiae bacterium]
MSEYALAAVFTALVTAISVALEPFTGYESIALLYLLLVVALGLRMRRGVVLTVAAASALLWNFVFIPPRLTFYIAKVEDGMMFAMFFIVAVAMGHLTTRLRRSELAERRRERRTAALYELAHQAAFASDLDTGLRAAVSLVESIFATPVALHLRGQDHALSPAPHAASTLALSAAELDDAARVFAGASASENVRRGEAQILHVPLQGRAAGMGVLSIRTERPLDASEKELLEAFAVLIGLTLEKDHVMEAFKRAEILEASARLSRTLLESVSHELKTPLAALQTGVDALAQQTANDERAAATIREMQWALRRQHRVINNLLDMNRLESGVVHPKLDWCDMGELAESAVELAGDALAGHSIAVEVGTDMPMVKADPSLLERCLSNLLLNAAANSPPGSTITVRARMDDGALRLSVLDSGPGISPEDLPRIFEPFYRGAKSRPGGTGLGLSIVDGFVRAHGGGVAARNRAEGGAEFVMRIPVEILQPQVLERLG